MYLASGQRGLQQLEGGKRTRVLGRGRDLGPQDKENGKIRVSLEGGDEMNAQAGGRDPVQNRSK